MIVNIAKVKTDWKCVRDKSTSHKSQVTQHITRKVTGDSAATWCVSSSECLGMDHEAF